MKNLFIGILYLLFSITTIGQQKLPDSSFTGVLKDTDKNGKLIKETPYIDGEKNGVEKEFGGFDAKLISIKTYKNDSLNGLSEEYYTHWIWRPECTNIYIKPITDIREGKPKGGSQDYYVDSVVKKELYYKNGKLNGLSKEYYKNGKLKYENTYVKGKLNGVSEAYYENGTLKSQADYKNGMLYSAPIEYDSKGAVNSFSQTEYNFYNEKGQLIADTNYKIGKKQMEIFIPIESFLTKYIEEHIDYPEQSKDMNDTGYVIVSFKIKATDTLQEVKIEKSYEKKYYLSNEVKRVFKTIRIPTSAYSRKLRNKKYFLAIKFEIRGIDGVKIYKRPEFIQIMGYKTSIIIRN